MNPKEQHLILTENGSIQPPTWIASIQASLPDDIADRVIAFADSEMKKQLVVDPDAPPLETESGAELLAADLPDPMWAVPEMLPAGLTLLGGKPKVGKSWLALQIALAICSGGNLFGRAVLPGKVLYIALEDNKKRLQNRMKLQGWRPQDAENFEYILNDRFKDEIGSLDDSQGNERLAAQISLKGYRLVVIDTVGRAFSNSKLLKDQNAYQQVSRAFDPIQAIALATDCAVLGIDHHNKGSGSEALTPDSVADIQGSISKGGVADCVWGIYKTRTKKQALLQIDGRDIEEVLSLAITLDRLTAAWQCEGDFYLKKQSEGRQDILDLLASEGGLKLMEATSLLDRKKGNVLRDLNKLLVDNLITKDDSKTYHIVKSAISG